MRLVRNFKSWDCKNYFRTVQPCVNFLMLLITLWGWYFMVDTDSFTSTLCSWLPQKLTFHDTACPMMPHPHLPPHPSCCNQLFQTQTLDQSWQFGLKNPVNPPPKGKLWVYNLGIVSSYIFIFFGHVEKDDLKCMKIRMTSRDRKEERQKWNVVILVLCWDLGIVMSQWKVLPALFIALFLMLLWILWATVSSF